MSTEATMRVLDRSMRDEDFLDAVRTDPMLATAGYDLTDEERRAIADADENGLRDHLDDLALAVAVAVIVIALP